MTTAIIAPTISDYSGFKFVSLISNGNRQKIAIITSGNQNFYLSIDGLRNLLSNAKLEDRIEINSVIDIVNSTDVRDLIVDLEAEVNMVTLEVDSLER